MSSLIDVKAINYQKSCNEPFLAWMVKTDLDVFSCPCGLWKKQRTCSKHAYVRRKANKSLSHTDSHLGGFKQYSENASETAASIRNHGWILWAIHLQFVKNGTFNCKRAQNSHLNLIELSKLVSLSAQSIVHLTAQIQNMETRIANFFGGCRGPYFGPTNTINTKNYQKNTRGPILQKTPKMHCNAPQCSAM